MIKIKRITAALLSAMIIGTTFVTPAFAETKAENILTNDIVDVNGYQCRVVDGNYVTEIDGEKYIVIYLDEGGHKNINSAARLNASPLSDTEVDVSDGSEYKVSVNLNSGDHHSPVFIVGPSHPELSAYIWTGFWIPQNYYLEISTYSKEGGWGVDYEGKRPLINGYQYLLTGTAARLITKIQIDIIAEKSIGIKNFNYWVGKA